MKDVVCVRDVAGLALLPSEILIRRLITLQKAEPRSSPTQSKRERFYIERKFLAYLGATPKFFLRFINLSILNERKDEAVPINAPISTSVG
jgi:hypothetical protein